MTNELEDLYNQGSNSSFGKQINQLENALPMLDLDLTRMQREVQGLVQ